jgi:hypothetical protein
MIEFREVNIFGVYVAPFAPMMLGAWGLSLVLERVGDRFGIGRYVWHRALFNLAVYVIVLSLIVMLVGWL